MILIYGIFIFAPISMISSIPVTEKIGKTPFTIEEATLELFPVISFPGKWISGMSIKKFLSRFYLLYHPSTQSFAVFP